VSTRIFSARLEALEGRLAPAQLSLLPAVAADRADLAVSAHASQSKADHAVTLDVNSHASLVAVTKFQLRLDLHDRGGDTSPGVGIGIGVGVGLGRTPPGHLPDGPPGHSPDVPPVDVPPHVPPGHLPDVPPSDGVPPVSPPERPPIAVTPPSAPIIPREVIPSLAPASDPQQAALAVAAVAPVQTASSSLAISAITNAPQQQLAFLLPISLASSLQQQQADQAVPARGDVVSVVQSPIGGRQQQPAATFAVGGSGDLEEEQLELLPPPQREPDNVADRAGEDVAEVPLLQPAELAALEAVMGADFAPNNPGAGKGAAEEEAGPLLLAGLVGEGELPSWLVFAVAVSSLAVARFAATQQQRRQWREESPLSVDEIIS
jgi:hypothetical protein